MKLIYLFLLMTIGSFSACANDSMWQFIPQKDIDVKGERKIIPQQYIVVKLNQPLFKEMQHDVATYTTGATTLFFIPTPGGETKSFIMSDNSTLSKELADKYPDLKTYKGIGMGSQSLTATMDYTEFGFHAMVLDGDNTYYIDPYSDINTGYYICYYKKYYDKFTSQKRNETVVNKKCTKKCKCRHKRS